MPADPDQDARESAETATSPESCRRRSARWGRLKAGAPTAAKHVAHADPKVALAAVTPWARSAATPPSARSAAPSRTSASRSASGDRGAGTLASKSALPRSQGDLDKSTRFEAIAALAATRTSAPGAYLEGLGGKNATLARPVPQGGRRDSAPACR